MNVLYHASLIFTLHRTLTENNYFFSTNAARNTILRNSYISDHSSDRISIYLNIRLTHFIRVCYNDNNGLVIGDVGKLNLTTETLYVIHVVEKTVLLYFIHNNTIN